MRSLSRPDLSTQLPYSVGARTLYLDSTLQELSLYDYQVESYRLGREVDQAFDANPLLPGVILTDQGKLVGIISRRRFLEHLSRPYGLELFLKRPLKTLYRFAHTKILLFPSSTTIVEAAKRAVEERSADLLYEPIVVEIAPQIYRLIDVHQLLLAQAQIHQLATLLLNKLYQQLQVANQELQRLATTDALTLVANRRSFDEYLDLEWHRAARSQEPLSLILCDIDFFKLYNDTYGHQAGDACLQQVAAALQGAVRNPADLVARYGGEEFALVLPNTPAAGAAAVAQRIRSLVKGLEISHASSRVCGVVTLSSGIASMVPIYDGSPALLIAAADRALYRAKQEGRDKVASA